MAAAKKASKNKELVVKVNVTKSIIGAALCADSEKCAVAQAIFNTGVFKKITVGLGTATGTTRRGRKYRTILPAKVSDFIRSFDADKKSVKPFRCTLEFAAIN